MPTNGKTELGPEGSIDVKNCVFRYPTMPEVPVLKGVTINAPSNKVLAFVGASGKKIKVLLTVLFRLRQVFDHEAH